MMMTGRIRKAVIPVAGVGTRLLPATKSQPKEMLPVGRKPAVQYIVEEMADCQVDQILFVTGASKTSIEDHFDYDEELIRRLRESGKEELLEQVLFRDLHVQIHYTRQPMQLGLGDAVSYGENFTGQDPFVIALGDSIIANGQAGTSALGRMIEVFATTPNCDGVIAFEEVNPAHVRRYGIAQTDQLANLDKPFRLTDIIEKPKVDEAPSNYAVAGRYIFTPGIYSYLKQIQPGYGQELQLTDAIRLMIHQVGNLMGVLMRNGERRFDIGNYESYWKAFLYFALRDSELGPDLREFTAEQLSLLR